MNTQAVSYRKRKGSDQALNQLRRKAHRKIQYMFDEGVHLLLVFCFIFIGFLFLFNWRAYSSIADYHFHQWFAADSFSQPEGQFVFPSNFVRSVTPELKPNNFEASVYSDVLRTSLYPPGMWLEVPKVFKGIIPIQSVDEMEVDFARFYETENKIQEALRKGVVQYPYTAQPDQKGNVFITGHSSYHPWDEGKYKEIFALLHVLEKGDEYRIFYKGKTYSYRVTEKFEVQPWDVSVLNQPDEGYFSTLMTCTPVGTTLRRLIIKAERISISSDL